MTFMPMLLYVCVCIEGKTEEKGFFGGVVQSLVAHVLKVFQVHGETLLGLVGT